MCTKPVYNSHVKETHHMGTFNMWATSDWRRLPPPREWHEVVQNDLCVPDMPPPTYCKKLSLSWPKSGQQAFSTDLKLNVEGIIWKQTLSKIKAWFGWFLHFSTTLCQCKRCWHVTITCPLSDPLSFMD